MLSCAVLGLVSIPLDHCYKLGGVFESYATVIRLVVSSKVMHAVSRLYEMLAQYSNKKALVCITEESPRMPHIIKITIAGIVD